MSTDAHSLRFIDAVDRTGLYTVKLLPVTVIPLASKMLAARTVVLPQNEAVCSAWCGSRQFIANAHNWHVLTLSPLNKLLYAKTICFNFQIASMLLIVGENVV